jgi:hypothetical protein
VLPQRLPSRPTAMIVGLRATGGLNLELPGAGGRTGHGWRTGSPCHAGRSSVVSYLQGAQARVGL